MTDSDGDDLRSRTRASPLKALIVALIIMAAVAGIVSAVTDGVDVSGDITLNAPSGPEVTFTDRSTNANLTQPFPDANTVVWEGDDGNVTVSADSSVSLDIDQIEGTHTNVSDVSAGAYARVDPDDKQAVEVKDVTYLNFTDMQVDDGNADFVMDGTGQGYVNISGLPAGETVRAVNSSGELLGNGNVNSNGWLNLTVSLSTQTVTLQTVGVTTAPTAENPRPEGRQNDFPTTLSVDISDPDLPQDNVTVDFEHNGNGVGSDFVTTEGGTASTSISTPPRGENTVNVTMTDTYGNVATFNYTFSTPENLTIRDAVAPDTIIDDREITVTFYGEGDEAIVNRTTTNGNVSMDGLPIEDNLVVELSADNSTNTATPYNYYDVESVVIDFTQQTDVYMLRDSRTAFNTTFTLDDRTGGLFSGNNPAVRVDRPINRSGWSSPRWEAVYGDEFGPAGTTAQLEEDQRYRLRVINDQGDERVLGAYYPNQEQIVNLEVGSIGAGPSDPETNWGWNATWNREGLENVRFGFNDTQNETTTIYLTIYEFNNESNVLLANTSFTGPYGTFSYSEPVPASQNETTWVVDAVIVRGDQSFRIQRPVGPQQPVLPDLPPHLKIMISLGTLLIVAGLFSQLNGHIGGLVLAGLGGIFWFVDFLPPGVNIGMVVLAMVTAAVIFLRERADQGVTV